MGGACFSVFIAACPIPLGRDCKVSQGALDCPCFGGFTEFAQAEEGRIGMSRAGSLALAERQGDCKVEQEQPGGL